MPASSVRSWSIDQPVPSPTRNSLDLGGQRRVIADARRRPPTRRTSGAGTDEGVELQHAEVAVRDVGQRRQRDRRLALLVLVDEAVEQLGDLLALAEPEPCLLHRLAAAPA